MKGLKKWGVALLSAAVMVTAVPMAFSATAEPAQGTVTATKDFVRDQTGAPIQNADGSYTIKLSVSGEPYTELQKAQADVVLVVDNSGSMASSVGENCLESKDNFTQEWTNLWYSYTCPKCGAKYSSSLLGWLWDTRPEQCTGQIGAEPRIDTAKAVSKEFADKLLLTDGQPTGNQLAVIGFSHNKEEGGANDTAAIYVKQELTADLTKVNTAIDKMKADGGTNYSAALQQAYTWLNGRTGEAAKRPAYVIFVSDGAPGLSGNSINDTNWNGSTQAKALKDAKAIIYTVGISLDDTTAAYLKSLASDGDHYINVTGRDYKTKLQAILTNWAEQINSIPAGKEAVFTDVINTEEFDITTTTLPEGVTLGADGKTLTWTIGDITKNAKEITFHVKPKDGKYGELFTNTDASLAYKDGKDNSSKNITRENIEQKTNDKYLHVMVLDPTPAKPTADEIKAILTRGAVKIDCVNTEIDPQHADKTYDLLDAANEIQGVQGNETNGWTVDIKVNANKYLTAYNTDTGVTHTFKTTPNGEKIVLAYDAATETWALQTGSSAPITYEVVCETPAPELKTIHVAFYPENGGTALSSADMTATSTAITPPQAPAKTGYNFDGWQATPGTNYTGEYTFAALSVLVGDNFNKDGEAWISFYAAYKEKPVEKTITVKFDANGGSWTDSVPATNQKTFTLYENTPTAESIAPAVTAPTGKVFDKWVMQEGTMLLGAEGTFTYNALTTYVVNDNTTFTFKATYKDAPVEEDVYTVQFNANGGSWTDSVPATNNKVFTLRSTTADERLDIPGVIAPEGKKFVRWEATHGTVTIPLVAAGSFTYNSFASYVQTGEKNITFYAIYEDEPDEEEKTLRIFWAIDNKENAKFTLSDSNADWTETIAWSDKDNTFVLPKITVADGYKLAGWSVSGKESNYWDADATTFGLTGLIIEDENGGYVAITANIVKDEEIPSETTYTVTFNSQGGSSVAAQTVKENETATKPKNPTRSGYTFAGWYTEASCQNQYDFSTKVTKDITLYADWTKNSNTGGNGDSSNTSYIIKASSVGNGKISPSGECYVGKGYDKTFTFTPDKGYEISRIVVDGESVKIRDEYTFENVSKDHTIVVTFAKEVEDPDNTGVSGSLNTKDHFQYLYGYPDGSFDPNKNMTRAEVAQMFFNLLTNKDVKATVTFPDVKNDQWYAQAVNTMATLKVVNGYTDGTFKPNAKITRAEFTAIAMRFGELNTDGENTFRDVSKNDWFYKYIVGSIQYGWINGYPDGTFKPNATITRAEVTTIVNKMLGRSADQSYVDNNTAQLNQFTDLAKNFWAYYDIREATNGHDYNKKNNAETWTKLVK